ncbi:MAG: hypothetical protein AB1487_08985, partial [Thermodesulfobacteriota bacterium]
ANTVYCINQVGNPCESPVRENRTLGLSGGRRPAFRGASSDPTEELRPLKKLPPWPALKGEKTTDGPSACIPQDISPEERDILVLVEEYPQHIDELVRRGNLVVQKVSSILLNLELKGLVQQLPGKLFVRK